MHIQWVRPQRFRQPAVRIGASSHPHPPKVYLPFFSGRSARIRESMVRRATSGRRSRRGAAAVRDASGCFDSASCTADSAEGCGRELKAALDLSLAALRALLTLLRGPMLASLAQLALE
ncbi:hypothetical protein TSOC_001425, partial [Tetrabaena socialis]